MDKLVKGTAPYKKEKKEKLTLSKRTDKEEVTKTIEEISNGCLLTVDKYNYDDGKHSCMKKYFATNPLKMEKEEEVEEENSDFISSWNVLA